MSKENWEKDWGRLRSYTHKDRTHHNDIKKIISNIDFDCFIDCGPGSVGSEAWSVKDLTKVDIIGFEPQTERFNMLKEHNYPGELHKKGVGEKIGVIEGLMGYEGGKSDFWLNGDDKLFGDEYKKSTIEITTIDDILKNKNYKKVFIWADIEGSELLMLKGAKNSLDQGIITGLNLELREKSASKGHCTAQEVIDYLKIYNINSITSRKISGSHKDFLFKLI